MSDVVIVAIISGICSLAGTFFGIIESSRLINYRLKQLEDRVNKHNQLVERMTIVEQKIKQIEGVVFNGHHN